MILLLQYEWDEGGHCGDDRCLDDRGQEHQVWCELQMESQTRVGFAWRQWAQFPRSYFLCQLFVLLEHPMGSHCSIEVLVIPAGVW